MVKADCEEHSDEGPFGMSPGQKEATWRRSPGGGESEGQRYSLGLSSASDTGESQGFLHLTQSRKKSLHNLLKSSWNDQMHINSTLGRMF